MRGVGLAILLSSLALAGCLSDDAQPPASEPAPSTSFIALGDMGMGNDDQAKVAAAIASVCALRGCDFAVGLGDNIYPSGASSPNDPQFDTKFEQPYANLSFPFWMVLGNHDNDQDPTGSGIAGGGIGLWYAAGDHEVAYTYRTDRASEKWQMPARHYAFHHGDVDFLALDTNTFMWYGVPVAPELDNEIQEQETWLPGAVAALNHTWKIGLGHHPYLSNSEHGNAGSYDEPVLSLFPGHNGDHFKEVFEAQLCGKLDLYLAGHDHSLQWLEPIPSCPGTEFIISGGGGAGLYDIIGDGPAYYQESKHGFFWIHITGNQLEAVAYDEDGVTLFSRVMAKS